MFMEDDNQDPTPADVGRFLDTAELNEWFQEMQRKYPQIYLPTDTLFGTYNEQHGYGQRLKTFFDDDPNKPMNCTVVGSKWNHERTFPGMGAPMNAFGKEPMYVIRINGELSQIVWTSAHEESGWKRESSSSSTHNMNMGGRYNGCRPNYRGQRVDSYYYPDPTRYGWTFTGSNETSRVEFYEQGFGTQGVVKLDLYYTTGTVKTVLDHPRQGVTQLFGKGGDLDPALYLQILQNPRVHTNVRYHRR